MTMASLRTQEKKGLRGLSVAGLRRHWCRFPKAGLLVGLAVLLASSAGFASVDTPNRPGAETAHAADSAAAGPLRIVYFNSPTCGECRDVKKALPAIINRWGSRIRLEQQSIEGIEAFDELFKYEEHYGANINAPPVIFVGSQYLVGAKPITGRLDDVIARELSKGSVTFVPPQAAGAKAAVGQGQGQEAVPLGILSRFQKFSVGAVAVAGLIDGVNPCAFTTIVFLLSMLAYLGKSKRELAVVGTGFTVAVFATYFLLGLGLLGAIKSFSVSSGISSGLACGVGILAFVLAGWSFWDFIQYKRTGDIKKVTLGLPKSVRQRIHKVIRKGLTTRGLVVGSITVGFLVAVLESLCTGQVYLPTIVFLTRAPGLRGSAIAYLLLYNLMFILPLVGILIIGYLGVKSEYMGNFLRRRLAAVKLAMAILFAGLGMLVMATVY